MLGANPWTQLSTTPPYLLEADAPIVTLHNERRSTDHQFRLKLLPEPFMGRLDSPVVLLNLNPGYAQADEANYSTKVRQSIMVDSLTHSLPDSQAFYFLDDAFGGTGGSKWWRKKLNPMIRECGLEAVREGVQVIEYVPYKSKRFHDLPRELPSQRYSFSLVRAALERDATLVIMRSQARWMKAIPGLRASPRVHVLRNHQNVTIGPGNCPTGFDQIIDQLKS